MVRTDTGKSGVYEFVRNEELSLEFEDSGSAAEAGTSLPAQSPRPGITRTLGHEQRDRLIASTRVVRSPRLRPPGPWRSTTASRPGAGAEAARSPCPAASRLHTQPLVALGQADAGRPLASAPPQEQQRGRALSCNECGGNPRDGLMPLRALCACCSSHPATRI
jgi:hypothetical protein